MKKTKMKNRAEISVDRQTGEIVVADDRGKEVYRAPKTERHISIANTLYMYHKYKDRPNRGTIAE
jgi:L-asparaginase II